MGRTAQRGALLPSTLYKLSKKESIELRWVLLTRSIFLFFHSFLANAERIALPLTGPGGKIAVFETSKPGNQTFETPTSGNPNCLNILPIFPLPQI